MRLRGASAVVTGGASGLGLATARRLAGAGWRVVVCDLPGSAGAEAAGAMGARFVAADVTSAAEMEAVFDAAASDGPLRACVHCAGRGQTVRVLDREGQPGSQEAFDAIVRLNVSGSFNVLRLAAARMARADPVDDAPEGGQQGRRGGERGVVVLTASIAAYEGQVGQMPYAASKAGVVGMTLPAARDLAARMIRVVTIAPGIFDTPLLARLPEPVRASLGASVPHPARLGHPEEFAMLAEHIIENPMLNGETIRLDGGLRMAPR